MSRGISLAVGISVAVSTGCSGVSEGGIDISVSLGVKVGSTTMGRVGEGANGAVGGT